MQLSIVIPAFNEGAHIERIVREIHKELQKVESDFEVIVVDNGSTDNTQAALRSLKRQIPRLCARRVFPNCGYGGGVLEGLAAARGDIVGWIAGDGQVRAADLRDMYKKMQREGAIFFKVRRTIRHDGTLRAIQSGIYNFIFHMLFPTSIGKVNDVNGHPKLFRRSFYENAGLASADWFIDAEIIIKALRSGIPIREYPVIFESRKEGTSKINMWAGLEFIKNLLCYRFFHRRLSGKE